jgi:hypothetical protein
MLRVMPGGLMLPHGIYKARRVRIELQAFFLFTAVAVMFTDPGAFAINRR